MTTFKLVKKSVTKALAKFHILNARNETVGSVNIPPSEISDLLRNWSGATDSPQPSSQSRGNKTLAAAFLKSRKPTTKAAILRGC